MWLCIDQGGHSSRAVVFGRNGETLARGAAALQRRVSGEDIVEHEPAQLLDSVWAALEEVAAQLGDDCARVEAAGIATQRSTLLCVSKSTAEPLSPVISWQDRRGSEGLARFQADHRRVKEITGLRISPHYGVGKLRWCMSHLDAVRESMSRDDLLVAPLASFLLRRLTGSDAWLVDAPNASRTLLMDARSLDWSEELLALFRVQRSSLPRIVPCRFPFGHLQLGRQTVPLLVCTGDQSAAVFCTGAAASGTALINIGTGAFMQCVTGDEPLPDERLLSSIVWQDESSRLYVLEGTVNGAASALDAVAAELGYPTPPRADSLQAEFASMAGAPLYLNGVSGLGSPDWVAHFPSQFRGEGSSQQKLAAVYESIVFLIMRNLEHAQARLPLRRIVLTGGLSRVDWLAEQLAALSGLTVLRLDDPEATLRGLAHQVSGGVVGGEDGAGMQAFPPLDGRPTRQRYERWRGAMEEVLAGIRAG